MSPVYRSAYSATGTLHVPGVRSCLWNWTPSACDTIFAALHINKSMCRYAAEVGEELLAMPRRCCPATGNVPDDRCLQKMYALQMLIASATPHKLFEEFYDVCLETASLWTGWMMNLSEDLRSAEGVSCLLQLLESLATLLLCQQFSGSQPQHAAAKYQGLKLGEMLELPWSKLSKRDDGCPAEEMQLHQSRWTLDSARRSSLRTSYLHQAISHKCQHQRGAWDSAATSMRIVRKSLADSSPDVRALAVAALPFVFYMEPSRAKPAAHTERWKDKLSLNILHYMLSGFAYATAPRTAVATDNMHAISGFQVLSSSVPARAEWSSGGRGADSTT